MSRSKVTLSERETRAIEQILYEEETKMKQILSPSLEIADIERQIRSIWPEWDYEAEEDEISEIIFEPEVKEPKKSTDFDDPNDLKAEIAELSYRIRRATSSSPSYSDSPSLNPRNAKISPSRSPQTPPVTTLPPRVSPRVSPSFETPQKRRIPETKVDITPILKQNSDLRRTLIQAQLHLRSEQEENRKLTQSLQKSERERYLLKERMQATSMMGESARN